MAADWEAFLTRQLGHRVEVAYGRARGTPIRATGGRKGLKLRLHRGFSRAPDVLKDDVASWLKHGRGAREAWRRLREWMDGHLGRPPAPLPPRLAPAGRWYDLDTLAAPLFAHEFRGDFPDHGRPALTWGRRARSRARRSLTLGSFDPAHRVVRVHAVLDHAAVPAWFVRFILFHEILHAALPGVPHRAAAFRSRERAYPDYGRAVRYERRAIRRLIRRARRGS